MQLRKPQTEAKPSEKCSGMFPYCLHFFFIIWCENSILSLSEVNQIENSFGL
jgi:hypothetical protein